MEYTVLEESFRLAVVLQNVRDVLFQNTQEFKINLTILQKIVTK